MINMSSNFTRFKKSPSRKVTEQVTQLNVAHYSGTKPYSTTSSSRESTDLITSTGLRELDSILNGGQVLGTLLVIHDDRFLDYGTTLAQYWCAEGLAHNQRLGLCVTKEENSAVLPDSFSISLDESNRVEEGCSKVELERFVSSIPLNLHQEKQKEKSSNLSTKLQDMHIREDEEDVDEMRKNDDGMLNIAWQYQSSIQESRSGISKSSVHNRNITQTPFCHSYDLSKSSKSSSHQNISYINLYDLEVRQWYTTIWTYIQSHVKEHPREVLRLFILHPPISNITLCLTCIMHAVKTYSYPVVLLCILQNHSHELDQCANCILTIQGLVNKFTPVKFLAFEALLSITKLQQGPSYYHNMTRYATILPAYTYGMKRFDRKLNLKMLHIPPAGEEETKDLFPGRTPSQSNSLPCASSSF